ncbi:hypothetical protein F2Q69_00014423 [Brassica cretica]|uniref:Serine-threonine/tyrosine-protein kinase catalytic domain-containing protein n=2 Tax=Brassica TaxID=3705 RepID=A0A8S9QU35_BRACR|nr:hypothetical protein F2Q69_00014423 [Brassica cretica]
MRADWSRVTSLSNLLLIPPFPFPCAHDFGRRGIGPSIGDSLSSGNVVKGEVLGSRLTNNLIMELERTHNGGVGVGALQRFDMNKEVPSSDEDQFSLDAKDSNVEDEVVAIKELDRNDAQGIREFVVEVTTRRLTNHPNLVKLIGFCAQVFRGY